MQWITQALSAETNTKGRRLCLVSRAHCFDAILARYKLQDTQAQRPETRRNVHRVTGPHSQLLVFLRQETIGISAVGHGSFSQKIPSLGNQSSPALTTSG